MSAAAGAGADGHGRVAALVGLAGVVAVVVVAVALGSGFRDTEVRYAPSGAWLATQGATNIAHVHGGTRQLDARVNVARAVPGIGDLAVAQGDTGVYLIDGRGCTVHRLDEVRQNLAKRPEPKALVAGDDCSRTQVVQGDGHVFLVDAVDGRIEEVDPRRLDERSAVDLGGPLVAAAAAADGLLVAAPADRSELDLVRDGERVGTLPLSGAPGVARLARVGRRVVVVDPSAPEALVLDGQGRVDRQVALPTTGPLVVLAAQDGPVAWIGEDGEDGERLLGVDPATGTVIGPIPVPDELGDVGAPVGVGDAVVVPTDGFGVGLLDARTGALRQRVDVGEEAAEGSGLEVVALAGQVFVHAPVGRQAAVCDEHSCAVIDKQDPAVEEVEATPPEEDDPPVTPTTARRTTTTPTTAAPDPAEVAEPSSSSSVPAPEEAAPTTTSTTSPPPPPAPPGPVQLVSEPTVTATTATLRWLPAASAVVPVWYELEVDGVPASLPGPQDEPRLEHTVSGLSPGVSVELRVRARNAVGPGPWTLRTVTPSTGAPIAVRASDASSDLCVAAGAPGAPCAEDDGGGQVVVWWQAPSGGGVEAYDVACGEVPGLTGVPAPGATGVLVPAADGVPSTCRVVSLVGGRPVGEASVGPVTAHGLPAPAGAPTQQGDQLVWSEAAGATGYVVQTGAAAPGELDVGGALSADLRAAIGTPGVYDVSVVARNDRGRAEASATVAYRRGLDAPVISIAPGAFEDPAGRVQVSWQAGAGAPTHRLRTSAPGLAIDCGGPCDLDGGTATTLPVTVTGLTARTDVPIVVEAVADGFEPVSSSSTITLEPYALATISTGTSGDDALYDCSGGTCTASGRTVADGTRARIRCRPGGGWLLVALADSSGGWVQRARLSIDDDGAFAAVPTTCPP